MSASRPSRSSRAQRVEETRDGALLPADDAGGALLAFSRMSELNRPVLVVDLRASSLAEDRAASDGASSDRAPALPPDEPLEESETIDAVAVLHDASDAPLVLPIEPTRDRRLLDALARSMRFAALRGERIPAVAVRYGSEYERSLAFERRLPAWAYDGIDAPLPPALRALQRQRR